MGAMGWVEEKLEHVVNTVELQGEKTRLQMAQAMAETVRGNRIDGALPRPITANAVNYAGAGRLVGWSVRATGGEVILDLYDGPSADPARYVGTIDLASGTSQTVWFGPGGVSITESLFVAGSGAGTPAGALLIGAVD